LALSAALDGIAAAAPPRPAMPTQESTPVQQPTCDLLVYNNPTCRGEMYNPTKDERITAEGYPCVRVRLGDLPVEAPVKASLTVEDASGRALVNQTKTLEVAAGAATWELRLDRPLAAPTRATLEVTQGQRRWAFAREVRLHRLYGRATDFEGHPIAAYVSANGHPGCTAQAAPDGHYEIWLPETYFPAFFVADTGYAQKSLEVWVYDYRPRADLELDMRIGQLELYELQAWRGIAGLKVDFIPQSIGLINRALRAAGPGHRQEQTRALADVYFGMSDAKPFLNQQDISVELDGKPLTIDGWWEREEPLSRSLAALLGPDTDRPRSRPEYTLQLSDAPGFDDPGKTQVLRVVISRRYVDGNAVITEKGEGYYLGLQPGWGVSGGGR
jgi:hypothetical protein